MRNINRALALYNKYKDVITALDNLSERDVEFIKGVINDFSTMEPKTVEFISYDGAYPSLCSGTLVVRILGNIVKFGYGEDNPPFWQSGGCIDYTFLGVEVGAWKLDIGELADKYKPYAQELIKVFNENVEYGCCGGCIYEM